MSQPKKSANTTRLIGIISIALLVYFFLKYPLFFIAGLVLILAVLVLAYFKVPKFNAWVKGKFQRKVKKPETTASMRQNNDTAATYLCNSCGGQLQPVANWPKFMACENCHKVQQKIN
jgi:uncharacterized membrane protein